MRRLVIALSFVFFVFAALSSAQVVTPTEPLPTATERSGVDAQAADPSKKPAIEVAKFSLPAAKPSNDPSEKTKEEARQTERCASLGDSIQLTTGLGLGAYLDYAAKQKKAVTLFLDGNDTGVPPEAIDRDAGILRFHLERNKDNKKIWSALLRDPIDHPTRRVTASIGLTGEPAEKTMLETWFTLVVVKWEWYAFAWLALLIVLLILFGWLVLKRGLLRDGPAPSPYSLGRCQMAWWFFLILFGYVMIWLISGDQDTITPSLLALMGISAATALGSALIESTSGSSGLPQAAAERLALQAAQQNAQQNLAIAQSAATVAPTDLVLQKQLADAQANLAVADAKLLEVNNRINGIVTVPVSRNLLRDILSDSNGTFGLHRFQIAVWTVVLGIIFVVSVVTDLSMPEFSTTLLATMGISASTYLGFKPSEK